jgi:hypothetical protein
MWDAGDLRHDFNALMNSTSCLTNNIKLLSQQILQHGQEADLGIGCDILLLLWQQMLGASLAPFRSAERCCLGRRNQMIAPSWRGNGNSGVND